jgi:hypothetical protein
MPRSGPSSPSTSPNPVSREFVGVRVVPRVGDCTAEWLLVRDGQFLETSIVNNPRNAGFGSSMWDEVLET